jgi:hypothetical protein
VADWTSLLDGLNAATLSAFGGEVTYIPGGGESVAIRAVFQPTRKAEENSPGVYGVLFIRLGDLARAPERGDRVMVAGAAYTVYDIEADASGAAVLRIRKA